MVKQSSLPFNKRDPLGPESSRSILNSEKLLYNLSPSIYCAPTVCQECLLSTTEDKKIINFDFQE